MSSVTIKNVTKSFGSAVVLDNFDAVFADVKDFTVDVYGHFVYLSTESSEDGYQNFIGTESFTAAVG